MKDKEKSNFCDWFEARAVSVSDSRDQSANPLDQLFGGSSQPKPKSKLEEEFEAFFKKK